MKNTLRVISIVLIAMFIAATCQASGYRGTGRQGYGNNMHTIFDYGHGRSYHGGHRGAYHGGGYGHRGFGFSDDVALIAGILVGGSIINNIINQPSAPPPEETICTKSTTTTWENGHQVGTTTTENCDGYRNTTRY